MMFDLSRILLALALLSQIASSEITGTFFCHLCNRQECSVTNLGTPITVNELGTFTCMELNDGVNAGVWNPQECSHIQAVTRATSNKCGCMKPDGQACGAAPFAARKTCDLCQNGDNMVLGDPGYLIQGLEGNMWNGKKCFELFDMQDNFDFSENQCTQAQAAAQEQCRCTIAGTPVKQCIPQESYTIGCDPDPASDDKCCIGSCEFLASHGKHVCTTKAGDVPSPTDSPIYHSLPQCVETGSGGCTSDNDCCIGSDICAEGNLQGQAVKVCTGTAGSMASMLSKSSGGGNSMGRSLAGGGVGRKSGQMQTNEAKLRRRH